jgi:hypothetical protein
VYGHMDVVTQHKSTYHVGYLQYVYSVPGTYWSTSSGSTRVPGTTYHGTMVRTTYMVRTHVGTNRYGHTYNIISQTTRNTQALNSNGATRERYQRRRNHSILPWYVHVYGSNSTAMSVRTPSAFIPPTTLGQTTTKKGLPGWGLNPRPSAY